uniref:Uncharacterized protein n=1 Tax=Timema bartmani TaxID=61472 RepID=A0A7R9ES83_9NEOP|nr:unnamed protein product [Timema bartmani]
MVCRLGSIPLGNVKYKLNIPWCEALLKERTPSSDERQHVNNLNQHQGLLDVAADQSIDLMNSLSSERSTVGRERKARRKVSLNSGLFIKAFNDILKQNTQMNQPISYFSSISRPNVSSESSLPKRSEVLESSSALRCAKGDELRGLSEGNSLKVETILQREPLDVGSVAKPLATNVLQSKPFEVEAVTKPLPTNVLESKPFEAEAVTKPLPTNELQSKPFEVGVSKKPSPGMLEGVKREFPRPKETVHNFYMTVVQELKNKSYRPVQSYKLVPNTKGSKNTVTNWSCTWQVRWPTESSFTSVGRNKAEASHQVALEILHWLRAQGKLNSKGTPVLYTSQEVRELKKTPPEMNLSPGWSQKLLPLLQQFYQLGDVVGYQVRLQSSLPHPDGGALFFCTTGILLRRLQSNPGLQGLSHVIVDEAHERDINTDLLLVMLRRAMDLNPELRLIIMSATINAGLFQTYFEGAATLHVPGFTHPVESYFLEDLNIPGLRLSPSWCDAPNPSMDWREVAKVVSWVNQSQPSRGAILCFLPGWSEIEATFRALSDDPSLYVLRVHSRLPYDEQALIFQPPPDGLRKVILATNIAETSITVEDVVFVVDTGAHKENRLNEDKSMSSLDNQWVSQANVNQRRGRAGRVRPGKSFHLYTKDKYHRMEEFPIPEVLRVSLEKAVMDCKVLCYTLHSLNFCVSPVLTVGTILSGDADLFQGSLLDKEGVRKSKSHLHTSSDHLALAWLYQEWAEHDRPMWFARDYRLNHNTCSRVKKLRRLLWQEVAQCMSLPEAENDHSADLDADWNRRAQHDELVKGVLLSGFNSLLYRRNWDMRHGRMKKNTNRATITSESINSRRNTFPSPYLTYFHQVHSEERRMVMIHETSMVSPLTVALFKPGNLTSHAYKDSSSTKDGSLTEDVLLAIKGKRTVAMLCQKSDAEVICQLRETLWALVDYWVRRQGVAQLDPRVEHFQAVFLQTLSKVLHQAGRTIEYNERDSQQLVQGR